MSQNNNKTILYRFFFNKFLRCYLSTLALANISLQRYDLLFRSILLLLGDGNINPGSNTVSSGSIPLNTLPSDNCDESNMPSECDSYKDCYKAQVNSKCKIFEKKRLRCFTFEW